jgi:hypothetical protein
MRHIIPLILGVLLAINTTAVIILFMCYVPYNRINLSIVLLVSTLGYLGSAIYIDIYKSSKK